MNLLTKTTALLALTLIPAIALVPAAAQARPVTATTLGAKKYPAGVEPLSMNNSFFRSQNAPDFWRLVSFQAPQITNSACSLASGTLVLNGLRGSGHLRSEEGILTQASVIEKTGHKQWKAQTDEDGGGVSLREFSEIFPQALERHGFRSTVEAIGVRDDANPGLAKFEADLAENQQTAEDFVVINFDQGFVMNEAEVGHFAVIGAYDSAKHRVLIMDPDKDWYEPYWVPAEKLYQSMQHGRGYIKIRLQAN